MRIPYRNKLLIKKILRILGLSLAALTIFIIAVMLYADSKIVYDRNGAHLSNETPSVVNPSNTQEMVEEITPPEIIYLDKIDENTSLGQLGGYYITTSMLQTPEKVLQQLQTIREPCAVMIELKSIFGNFYYSTSIDGAQNASVDIAVVDQIIDYLRENNFYMIASIAAFSDSNFALANQRFGLLLKNRSALWMDEHGTYWLDPASDTVLSYLIQITRELATLGFREVTFSDFRFPSSNNIYYESDKTRTELIEEAAQELTSFFTGSNITISFSVKDTDFPAKVCNGRLYISDVDGSKIERFTQVYSAQNLTELVFLASSRDMRFEELAVLRPLLSQ